MPYQAVDWVPCSDKCDDWDYYTVPPGEDNVLWQVQGYGVTSGSEDDQNYWNLMKTWVLEHGPIIVDIYTGGWANYWSTHHSPTDVYENDDSGITNHAQVLCGWVDDPQILNGGYWILKNSWGTSWGYNGFSNIAYGCNSLGTRDVTWVEAMEWPQGSGTPPVDYDLAVFSNFDYNSEYPHPGDSIVFTDTSDGDVVLWEWDFNGDGTIDSTEKRPTHTYANEGEYEVTLTVHSGWGIKSDRTRIVGVKENWPPVVVLPKEKTGHGLSYQFDARYCYDPDGTIDSYLWDFGDGTTSDEQYPTHTYTAGDVIYEVILTLTDDGGGSSSGTCNLKIDQTVPPVTTIHHGVGSSGTDWYKETQRIYFYATDWTGVIDTFYRIDDGIWKRYEPSEQEFIPVGSEGEHTVEAYSVDYYGNEETPVSETFGIDKTEPTVEVSIDENPDDDGWYMNKATVTLTGDDELSGIGKLLYMYYPPMVNYTQYTGSFVIEPQAQGAVYLYVMAIDNAGNSIEIVEQIKIKKIAGPSKPTISGPSSGKPNDMLTYTIVSNDPGNEISYYIEWGDGDTEGWFGPFDSGEEVEVSHVYTTTGTKNIKVKAKNQHGAESDWGTFSVTMPKYKFSDNSFILRFQEKYPVIFQLLHYFFSKS
jgi:PKD repeat protein